MSEISDTGQEILTLLDKRKHTLDELVEEIDTSKPDVEDGIRKLLKRRLVGETADWKFFISMRGEQYLHADT